MKKERRRDPASEAIRQDRGRRIHIKDTKEERAAERRGGAKTTFLFPNFTPWKLKGALKAEPLYGSWDHCKGWGGNAKARKTERNINSSVKPSETETKAGNRKKGFLPPGRGVGG